MTFKSLPNRSFSRRAFLGSSAMAACGVAASFADDAAKFPTVDEEIRRAAGAAPLKLLFQGNTSAELVAWQKQFSTELLRRIGPHRPPTQWTSVALSTKEFDDYVREEWLLQADGVPSLPLYVLRPRTAAPADGRWPLILAVHGHGPYGNDAVAGVDTTPERAAEIKELHYDYGRQLVRRGYLVLAPCLTPFGRRLDARFQNSKQDQCGVAFVRMMMLGQTLIGANLRDLIWALDYASSRPDARADRIGCVGLSYGGRMTMLVTAVDPRVRVAVISGALNVMQERIEGAFGCGAQVIPGLLEIGDTPEIGSLIAPRPCIWEIGSKDKLLPREWAERAIARLQRAYAATGQPDNLSIHHFDGGHEWSGTTAVPLLERVLKGG